MTTADAAHDWDVAYLGPSPPWDIGRPQPALIRLADVGAFTGTVLDAGCGTGEHTILAARHSAYALGIDVSPRAIEIARHKAIERGVDTSFEVLDALRLDTLGKAFDTIIDSGLFHVFDDAAQAQYVTALHAVLRSGGHLHLMCFSDREPGDWGPRRVTEDELRAAFASGWCIESLAHDRFDINPVFVKGPETPRHRLDQPGWSRRGCSPWGSPSSTAWSIAPLERSSWRGGTPSPRTPRSSSCATRWRSFVAKSAEPASPGRTGH